MNIIQKDIKRFNSRKDILNISGFSGLPCGKKEGNDFDILGILS